MHSGYLREGNFWKGREEGFEDDENVLVDLGAGTHVQSLWGKHVELFSCSFGTTNLTCHPPKFPVTLKTNS